MKKQAKIKLELLAPAKNATIAIEAIKHGADAVYMGAARYGARSSAGNSIADIKTVVDFAHKYNVRVYVTVNTIIYNDELKEVENLIHQLYNIGVDALIVQDMGILRMNIPPIALHASTQCDLRTPEKARFLEKVGFSQLVMARELTLQEIKVIRESVKVPLEAFIHGALCVSYSGRCGLSYACTGRSANRGECAQMCRLPYNLVDEDGSVIVSDKHLLSLKDMNQSSNLRDLIEAGVSSFKIEGRLKDVDYVKNTVAFYRNELDKIIKENPQKYERSSFGENKVLFTPQLDKVFNRSFTQYFLENRNLLNGTKIASIYTPKSQGEFVGVLKSIKNGTQLFIETKKELANGDGISFFDKNGDYSGFRINKVQGKIVNVAQPLKIEAGTKLYRTFDKKFNDLISSESSKRVIRVDFSLKVKKNLLSLEITDERGNLAVVTAEVEHEFEKSRSNQATKQEEILKKLGNTIYVAQNVHVAGEYFIPNSVLSELRRLAVEKLDSVQRINYKFDYRKPENIDFKYFKNELDYVDNVANELSSRFYGEHGVKKIENALEVQQLNDFNDKILMHTRYCLLRELGFCRKDKKTKKLPQKLYLENERIRLIVETNCANCEMYIMKA